MAGNSYRTVLKEASDEFVEKKSRFIGHIKPVKTEAEAVAFINELKKKYWDATHNVYAYVLREGGIQRYSDDGEPGGTAGQPTLNVLVKEELFDVAVVVTRYFGGTLLGAGGLVRAYSKGSKIAVDAAGRCTMTSHSIYTVSMDYGLYDRMVLFFRQNGANLEDTQFTDKVTAVVSVLESEAEGFVKKVVDFTNGSCIPELLENEMRPIPDDSE